MTTIEQITFTNTGITWKGMCRLVAYIMEGDDAGAILRRNVKDISFKKVNEPVLSEAVIKFKEPQDNTFLRALLVKASDTIGEDFHSTLQVVEELHTCADRLDPVIADSIPPREGELPLNNNENTQPQGNP